MAKSRIKDFKTYLKSKSNADLHAEMLYLYKNFTQVKEYFALKIDSTADNEIVDKYKKIIGTEFKIRSNGGLRLRFSVIRKAISDLKKLSSVPKNSADLMLFSVEQGVNFTNKYGSIGEQYYNSLEILYRNSLRYLRKNKLLTMFHLRCKTIMINSDDIGWGFGDMIKEMYDDYFP